MDQDYCVPVHCIFGPFWKYLGDMDNIQASANADSNQLSHCKYGGELNFNLMSSQSFSKN